MQPTPSPLRYEGTPPSCQSWASVLTIGDRVGASSYPALCAGDALGERATATSWRTWPEWAAAGMERQ